MKSNAKLTPLVTLVMDPFGYAVVAGSGKSVIYGGIGINTLAGNARVAMLCTNDIVWRKTA